MIIDGDFEYELIEGTAKVTKYNGSNGDVIIESIIEYSNINYPVVSIGANAFKSNTVLTSIAIPNSVISIGNNAFETCSSLTSVTIIDGVNTVTIGNYAFKSSGLTSINIPNSVTTIGTYAFTFTKLTAITIPNSVTIIGGNAFINCASLTLVYIQDGDNTVIMGESAFANSGLTSIIIPKSVTSIGSSAFYGCASLRDVIIEDGVVTIETSAFRNSGLTSIKIPKSVNTIRDYAFYGCTSLTDVIIEDGVVTIGNYVFAALETSNQIFSNALISIIIPNSVTSIGNYAFNYCKNLTTVTIIDGVNTVTIGDYAFRESALKTITIPNSVTRIGSYAFYFCKDLTSVDIKDEGTVSILISAFSNTGLTSITIPKSVTSISTGAFYDCASLTSVTIEEGPVSIYTNAFKNTGLISITIPKSVTSISSGAFQTVKYAYIKGNDTNYTTPFATSTTVYYDTTSTITKTYPQALLFVTPPVTPATGGPVGQDILTIGNVFIGNNTTMLLGELKYLDEEEDEYLSIGSIESTFVGVTFFPVDFINETVKFTITLGNITFVDMNITLPSKTITSGVTKNTYTINTKKQLRIFKNLLPKLEDMLAPIEKMDSSLFTSVSQKYESIEKTYGLYSSNVKFETLSELANFGKRTLILLDSGLIPTIIGDKSLTFDGTSTFVSGERLELGNSFRTGVFEITLVAIGSSGITIEKIETSPICFPAGTPILTDQGYIPIDQITTQTLYNKPIQLTKTISTDKYLVCFEKDSLEKNVPFQRTIMSKDHIVYYKEYSLKAKDMIPYFDKVYKVKYTGEVLYNVLVDVHAKMKVNNMSCETLDPKHKMAKLYNLTKKEKEDMIVVWKEEKKERTQMKFK